MEYSPEYFQYSRQEMLQFIPKGVKTSLEVGCGAGRFSRSLRSKGIEAWGIEPEKEAFEEAIKNDIKCLNGLLHDRYAELPKYYFDVVVFNDVLEHMRDPWDALQLAKSLLRPGGHIVSSIPNIMYFPAFTDLLISRNFKYTTGGIFDRTHLRFFTRRSIVHLFESSGFEIKEIKGIHAYKSRKFTCFNVLTFGYFDEMKYMQFGVRAAIRTL